MTRKCQTCEEVKPLSEFHFRNDTGKHRPNCKPCNNLRKRKSPEQIRNSNLLKNYGITAADYDDMFTAQGGVCAICGEPESDPSAVDPQNIRRLAVDHDHSTGKVRSLLCGKCNKAIGLMADDPIRLLGAAAYLIQHGKEV